MVGGPERRERRPAMPRRRPAALLLGVALTAAGCAPAVAGDEAGKSADQVFADAVAALQALPGARIDGTLTDGDDHRVSRLHALVSSAGDARITATHGRQTFRVIIAGPREYLRAPAAFWRDT